MDNKVYLKTNQNESYNVDDIPKKVLNDIEYIREWIKKQPHIKCQTDTRWLLEFLQGCKFSLEKTKKKIDVYYTMRTIVPELLRNRNLDEQKMQDILNLGTFFPIYNHKDSNSHMLLIERMGLFDISKVSLVEKMKLNFMMMDMLMKERSNLTKHGAIVLVDLSTMTKNHLFLFTPTILKKLLTITQEAYPVRIKAVYAINAPLGIESVVTLAKTFMKEKLKNRIYVYGKDYEDVFKYIPREIVPNELGGNGGPLAKYIEDFTLKINSYSSWFKEQEKYCTNEKLRIGKAITTSDLFGVEGSFRKLDLD